MTTSTGNLNPEQELIARDPKHRDGARCVLAGPGSGKSKTMVEYCKTLRDSGVSSSRIICVTFSKEMAAVLKKRVGDAAQVSTFHSLGYKICSELGFKPVEPELRYRLLCKLCKKYHLEYKDLDNFISTMRRKGISPEDAEENVDLNWAAVRAYDEYESVRALEGWLDFDAMICDAVKALEDPKIRARWQAQYLIVDEAQDTDDLQWRMMQLMSEKYGNITVVGDPNQCQPGDTQVSVLLQTKKNICGRGNKRRNGWAPAEVSTRRLDELKDGDTVLSWTREDQRVYQKPRHVEVAKRWYDGNMLYLESNNRVTKVTPNHFLWVRWAENAFERRPHFVYLMWRHDLGFRVGTSHIRRNKTGGCFLSHRARQEGAERMWILNFTDSKQQAETWEEMISLKFGIPECMYRPYGGTKKSQASIDLIFQCANPMGGFLCLQQYGRLFESPIWEKHEKGNQIYHGYFKTAAANLIPNFMILPTDTPNGSAVLKGIVSVDFHGWVYSLNVEKDHTYVADGIPVGNCIYGFRGAKPDNLVNFQKWFPNGRFYYLGRNYRSTHEIVKFVRENAPVKTDLTEKMAAARADRGMQIELKMYWRDADEIESALKLANGDPLNSIILARTNRVVGLLEGMCSKNKIPYHLLGKTSFWKQNEIRKAIEALKPYGSMPTEAALNFALPALERKYAVDDRTDQDNDALENLATLRLIAKDYKVARDFVLHAYKMIHRRNDPRGVVLSTIHQAKGAEFKNVFLIGAKDGAIPHKKGDPQEERRIYFVAISRAKDRLRISWCGTPSPLLRKYLPEDILDALREQADEVERLQVQHSLFGG